jgi:predicted ATPase/DNA-binding SARP family transcriptional activator
MGEPRRFAILGPIEIRRNGRALALRGEKARLMLAVLLARRNTSVPTAELAEALWPERRLQDESNALHATVARLRRLLADDSLRTTPNGYELVVAREELDAADFERLLEVGRLALRRDDPAAADEAIATAQTLWRGRPFADLEHHDALQDEIRRLGELRVKAYELRADAVLRLGGGAELVGELEALVKVEPFNERLQARLIHALYRAGRQADALRRYREASGALRDELGLEPSRELRDLERAVLRQDPALDPQPGPAAVPVPATPLIGRETEVREVCRLLQRDDVRLLNLTGPGGVGKTRVALEAAQRVGAGVFVDLAKTRDAAHVPSTLAAAVGAFPREGETSEDAVERHLRERALLLVLDCFEHVLAAAPFLTRIASKAPSTKLLVTSRAVLGIGPEHEFPVGPLRAEEALQLFADRAEAVDPQFDLDGNASAVGELCRHIDRLPLAIELAAARVKLFPPPVILERLTSGREPLAGRRRDVPRRHQTLEATLDWSYELLDSREQELLGELGVFVGSFTLDAAEAVSRDGAILDGVASLVDKSLVQRPVDGRLRLLDTVRDYVLARGTGGAQDETRLRHARYYCELLAGANGELDGPREKVALETFEVEQGNARMALAFALESSDAQLALQLAVCCRRFWHVHGHFAEGRSALSRALALDGHGHGELRAQALNAAGILAAEQGDIEAARDYFNRSLDAATVAHDSRVRAYALGNLARMAYYEQRYEQARAFVQEALAASTSVERFLGLEALAEIALAEGKLDEALALAVEARELVRGFGSSRRLALVTLLLGRIVLARRTLQKAGELFEESLALSREVDEPQTVAESLEGLAEVAAERRAMREAAMLYAAAASIRASIGSARTPEAASRYERNLGVIRESLGEELFNRALASGSGCDLGEVLVLAGHPEQSR